MKSEDYGEPEKMIIKLGALSKVGEYKSQEKICEEVNRTYGTNWTRHKLQNFLNKNTYNNVKLIKEEKKLQSKLVNTYFDTVRQMKWINDETIELLYKIKLDPEKSDKQMVCPHCNKRNSVKINNYSNLIKTLNTLLEQNKHVDKILGKISKNPMDINVNFVDLSKKIAIAMPQLLHSMEKRGLVKINEKRLRKYGGQESEEIEND